MIETSRVYALLMREWMTDPHWQRLVPTLAVVNKALGELHPTHDKWDYEWIARMDLFLAKAQYDAGEVKAAVSSIEAAYKAAKHLVSE